MGHRGQILGIDPGQGTHVEHTCKEFDGKSHQGFCHVSLDIRENMGVETQSRLLDLHDDDKTCNHVRQHRVVAKKRTGNMQARTAKVRLTACMATTGAFLTTPTAAI